MIDREDSVRSIIRAQHDVAAERDCLSCKATF
ncbi:hypothetical protein SAMN05421757_1217 [Tropicimonas sediminicola]|uniref:Uncharacterized protein n=1 Tax=Tropicimonas sediminicola TaxID=1031541 RepID=A0A239MHZ6_9RHOB|nr:hypothetical protein SAMN05421757_1217 [Tropicimonas sediminicola]